MKFVFPLAFYDIFYPKKLNSVAYLSIILVRSRGNFPSLFNDGIIPCCNYFIVSV